MLFCERSGEELMDQAKAARSKGFNRATLNRPVEGQFSISNQ